MSTIQPTPEQFARLATSEDTGPVVMINLLRFKEHADGVHSAEGITGAEAYERYAAAAAPFLLGVGGRLLLAARAQESVIGPEPCEWDLVLAVRYPSRSAFVAMATDPGYLEVHEHRAAALSDSRLIATAAVDA